MKKYLLFVFCIAVLVACERQGRRLGGVEESSANGPAFTAKASLVNPPAKAEIASLMPGFEEGKIDGKKIFAARCSACHQLTGKGLPGVFPPLDGSTYVTGDVERLAAIILYGLQGPINVNGTVYNNVMAPLGNQLSDEEAAAVASYVRASWSNQASEVTPDVFAKVREKWGSRGMFNIAELGEDVPG